MTIILNNQHKKYLFLILVTYTTNPNKRASFVSEAWAAEKISGSAGGQKYLSGSAGGRKDISGSAGGQKYLSGSAGGRKYLSLEALGHSSPVKKKCLSCSYHFGLRSQLALRSYLFHILLG
jgi:hypothetical protein